jgi:hypothetical protein
MSQDDLFSANGAQGRWAQNGSAWSYHDNAGNLVATYRETDSGDPALAGRLILEARRTGAFKLGPFSWRRERSITTTIYLKAATS